MSLFFRFRGQDDSNTEVQKLPVWPTITWVSGMLEGVKTEEDIVAKFNLSEQEQAEFTQVQAYLTSRIASEISDYVALGLSVAEADSKAKSTVRHEFEQTLLGAETGVYNEDQFNNRMGLTD